MKKSKKYEELTNRERFYLCGDYGVKKASFKIVKYKRIGEVPNELC